MCVHVHVLFHVHSNVLVLMSMKESVALSVQKRSLPLPPLFLSLPPGPPVAFRQLVWDAAPSLSQPLL